jgi:methylglutaconyl-CoA hydratase
VSEGIALFREGPVVRIRLSRPERRNAFDDGMIRSIREAFEALAAETGHRVILIDAEGDSFCAGADLRWMQRIAQAGVESNRADAVELSSMFAAIAGSPVPVVALVRGPALGGGSGIVAAADIAIAEEGAVFGFTEVRLGIIPAVISPFVMRKVHAGDARRYFLTGERFDAREALRIGLVQILAESNGLGAAADRLVGELLAGGPHAQTEVKSLLAVLSATRPAEHAALTADWIARLRASEEGRAGMRAFLERERPPWTSPLENA